MNGKIGRALNIYPGEGKNLLLFSILGFLWAVGVSLGWKNSDALFLLNIGADKLPIAYGAIASLMIVIAAITVWAYDRFATHQIFLTNLTIGSLFYLLVGVFIRYKIGFESGLIWYAMRVFGWIFFCVVNTNFWTFIDQFYHIRDSKRLFSLFASAVFIGFGFTGLLMQWGLPEFQDVTLIIIAILIVTMFWVRKIVREVQPIQSEHEFQSTQGDQDGSLRQMASALLKSKFTLCLMTLNFMIFVSVILTEYNYMFAFEDAFGGEFPERIENEESAPLTLFLGKCIAFVSFFNLFFGLFLYSRLVRRFGLGNMLFVTPLLLIVTYTGWPFSATLFFPVLAYFISEGTFFVVDDNNFNLLLNGVPTKLKYKIRVVIESFFEPIGTLVAALLLSFAPIESTSLALLLAVILLIVSLIVRNLYPKAIYKNLMENAIHFEKTPKEWLPKLSKKEKKLSEVRLLSILKSGTLDEQDFAIEGILDFEDPSVIDALLLCLDSCDDKTKELFIQKLSSATFAKEPRIIEHLLTWDNEDASTDLKGALHLYLAKHGLLSPQKALLNLKSQDPKLNSAALIALKKSSGFSSASSAAEMRIVAAEHLQELLNSDDEESKLMGLQVLSADATAEDINILVPYLGSESIAVARNAAFLIKEVASPLSLRHAKTLIHSLTVQTDGEIRQRLIEALGKMADTSHVKEIIFASLHFRPSERRLVERIIHKMGLKTVPTLLSIAKDTRVHDRSRLLAGKILGRLAPPQLKANLFSICTQEIERAGFYFVHYHYIQNAYPKHDLEVLEDALLAGYHSVIDFIIQLLGVSGEIEDSELLSKSMRSHNPKVRSQVVETLERTCERGLFHVIQPLVDELPLSEKLKAFTKPPLSLDALALELQNSPSLSDQVASAWLASKLEFSGWRESIKRQMQGKEEIFHHFAYEVLES